MEKKQKKMEAESDELYICEKCGSEDIRLLETEYMMGKQIKRYICEHCETKFYISED